MIIQLNPPIPMTHIDKGEGYAIALIDYSQEHHLHWVVAINETGEIWTANNTKVRMQKNITLERYLNEKRNNEKANEKANESQETDETLG